MLPTKFQVSWPFVSWEEEKNRFLRWWPEGHLGLRIGTIFNYVCSTRHPDASCQVSSQLTFRFRRRSKSDFHDSSHGGHLGFPIGKILAILTYKSPWFFLPRSKSIGLLVQEKKRKRDFQVGSHGGHLRFPIRTILAICDLQVTPMPPTNFQVNWPFN